MEKEVGIAASFRGLPIIIEGKGDITDAVMPTLELYMDKQATKKKLRAVVAKALALSDELANEIASLIAMRAKTYEDLLSFYKNGSKEYEIRGNGAQTNGDCILHLLESGHALDTARTLVIIYANREKPINSKNDAATLPCNSNCSCWVAGYCGQGNGYK